MNTLIFILNILGTFLLSVEAIKLDNLVRSQKYLYYSNKNLNPQITWEDSEKRNILSKIGCIGFLSRILIIFYIPSLILTYLILDDIHEEYWICLIAIFGSFVMWTALILLIEIIIKLLKNIVNLTANGMIGIFGFIILVVSFSLQYHISK
ncbi:hypothetical protein [Flavobacterium sp. N502540]|uniref:hypothetical protein n=1 Tax=Flavobacterium sp. N502540 TaxID=2986838 RepID=UPI0022255926|nr:hypothetical protein [Flavobacterium sp. N502540]